MRRTLIVGNWKMNGSQSSIRTLLESIKTMITSTNEITWLVLPPFVYIEQVARTLRGTPILWGGQNLCTESSGAFTGEVSASMLVDLQCQYVLVGHSERRTLYGEDDRIVARKFAMAKLYHLKPILCVGETAEERDQGLTNDVVTRQLSAILDMSGVGALRDAVIAYEPVWAIGTGVMPTSKQVQEVHAFIRQQIAAKDREIAEQIPIIYGGSLKSDNAQPFFAMPDIDGGLLGNASLSVYEFLAMGRFIRHA